MYAAKSISGLPAVLSQRQMDIINDFFSVPVNWDEKKHGDKQKLDEDISVVFLAAAGTDEWKNVLEAHRRFYDLHCTMEGIDIIASKPVIDCSSIRTEYNSEGDYILFDEAPSGSIEVPAGTYCLIPPADAHMALYGNCGFVRKLVFKIPIQ